MPGPPASTYAGAHRVIEIEATPPDPADDVVLADTVGIALQVVPDRLTPAERVAFVLHDSFGVDFGLIAAMLDTTPAAPRKLASRALAKVQPPASEDALADWEVVDAFMTAAREGDVQRLLELLAPDVVMSADAAAGALGTPMHLEGRDKVAFDFTVEAGRVRRLQFRAADEVLAGVRRRRGGESY